VIDGRMPDDKQLIPGPVDQNPGNCAPVEGDHPSHDPFGAHWKSPSEGLVGWSIVVAAATGVIITGLTAVVVLLALR
jgi:hypothetical protein